jgi:uncharacterized membrane protein YfcA
MELTIWTYLLVCPLVFLAGFIDSIAGGGGLITLPAFLTALGMPGINLGAAYAFGSNKIVAGLGTTVSTGRYAASGKIPWKSAVPAAAVAFVCSYFGSRWLTTLPDRFIRIAVLAALPFVAMFVLANKSGLTPKQRVPAQYTLPACMLISLVIGVYDGVVGPGTGTFLQLLFVSVIGMEVLQASGAARLVNLASNIGALIHFVGEGYVVYQLALPAALFSMAGNYLGSTMAIKKGVPLVRALLAVVMVLLMVKMAYDLFF